MPPVTAKVIPTTMAGKPGNDNFVSVQTIDETIDHIQASNVSLRAAYPTRTQEEPQSLACGERGRRAQCTWWVRRPHTAWWRRRTEINNEATLRWACTRAGRKQRQTVNDKHLEEKQKEKQNFIWVTCQRLLFESCEHSALKEVQLDWTITLFSSCSWVESWHFQLGYWPLVREQLGSIWSHLCCTYFT